MAMKDGGPAFPNYERCMELPMGTKVIRPIGGMTLRDWFAGQALAGLFNHPNISFVTDTALADGGDEAVVGRYASMAYQLADAMLAARERER